MKCVNEECKDKGKDMRRICFVPIGNTASGGVTIGVTIYQCDTCKRVDSEGNW